MSRLIAGLFMAAWVFAAAPCGAEDVESAIAARATAWEKAFNAGDAAGIAALYTRDALLLPPNAQSITGRAAIEAFWSGALEDPHTATLESREIEPAGDGVAYEIGAFTVSDPAGKTLETGKYMVIWQREGGDWFMSKDIWNSDQALEPPTTGG
ncbi:MAG TPA: nuclear transport factor 2 family protein [Gammaproteobacteria bacterium]|nr:nuclear transport factor 2 family protein [Gammaproteobacteria bacterium]